MTDAYEIENLTPSDTETMGSVLIVDDDPAKLLSLSVVVSGMKLDVVTATSGSEALRELLKQDFAMILLDVRMPVMDGYEIAQMVRSRPSSAYTPIIFITAEAMEDEERIRGYELGAVDWMLSPIEPAILRAKITVFADLFYLKRIALRQAKEMHRMAHYDQLTGLPNRNIFYDRLGQEIKRAHRNNLKIALMFIDLDHFKEVNDTLGHSIGDLLLVGAADRMTDCIRAGDAVARMGGDEFTIILPDLVDANSLERVTVDILEKMAEPFQLEDNEVLVSASIGIALYPDDATDMEELIKYSDQAMYAAKQGGPGRHCMFGEEQVQIIIKAKSATV